MLTTQQRISQSKTKWRIIAAREMREWQRGERHVLGNYAVRREEDLVRQAYEAGRRDERCMTPPDMERE